MLSHDLYVLAEDLRDRIKADSLTETIRRAILLFDLIESIDSKGEKFLIRAKDGTTREIQVI